MSTVPHRILGIDYGDKRIGIAISDPLGITAQPLITLSNDATLMDQLTELIAKHTVTRIVVGNPINLKGALTLSTEKAQDFYRQLQQAYKIPVVLWDERLSTKAANRTLTTAKARPKDRKRLVDQLAAAFMLQGYLDRLNAR